MTNNPEPQPRLLLTVVEAARALAVGRTTLYELIDRGQLQTVTIGRSRRIPLASLSDFVASLQHGPSRVTSDV